MMRHRTYYSRKSSNESCHRSRRSSVSGAAPGVGRRHGAADLCGYGCDGVTAVRHRLVRLQAMELVSAANWPGAGRGRPHHIYRVTSAAAPGIGGQLRRLWAQILWRELRNIEEPAVRQRIASRVRRGIGAATRKGFGTGFAKRPPDATVVGIARTGLPRRDRQDRATSPS